MRFLRITTNYDEYLSRFYAKRPHVKGEPYLSQHASLMEDCYGWADFWTTAMGKLGYETCEIVANAEEMQKRWAAESGTEYDEPEWLFQIALAQIKAFRPDVLFVCDYATFTAPFLQRLKEHCPSIKLTLGWCGAPYKDGSVFREYDFVLSCIPELVQHFREQGHQAIHINHAFEPRILDRIDVGTPPSTNFAFLGSMNTAVAGHLQRESLLKELLKQTDLQLWLLGTRYSLKQWSKVGARQRAHDIVTTAQRVGVPESVLNALPPVRKVLRWEGRPESRHINGKLARRAHGPLFGLEMFQQLHDTRINLNIHIDISPVSASNMRLFEATGTGSCLLTDWKQNLSEVFEPDAEVVTYRSTEECIEKVRYLLDHEEERQAIAAAGQRRTLRDHSFDSRAEQLSRLIQTQFSN